MQKILKAAFLAAVLTLTACANMRVEATATETTLCREWGESLPTRSRSDTDQTQVEIAEAYADFEAACPEYGHLVPK